MKLENVSQRHIQSLIHRYIHLVAELDDMMRAQMRWGMLVPDQHDMKTLLWMNTGGCQERLGGKTIQGVPLPWLSGSLTIYNKYDGAESMATTYKLAQKAAMDLCTALGALT